MFRPRTDAAPALHVELLDDVLVVSGPDLDLVLAEVGAQLGPDAEVLDARREIVGGIAGFFGREQFTVEATVGGAELAEGLDAGADGEVGLPLAQDRDAQEPIAQDAAAQVQDGTPARGTLDGPSFAKALAAALAEADEVHPGLSSGALDLLHDPSPSPLAPATPASPVPAATPVAAAGDVDPLSGDTRVQPATFERVRSDRSPTEPASVQDPGTPAPSTSAVAQDPAPAEVTWDEGSLLALAAPDMTRGELAQQLARLVGTPPALPGHGIVAVVGDPADALATAETLAARIGLDPADVVLAAAEATGARPAWLTVTDAADAARRRARWVARDTPTVVAVAMHPGIEGLHWAAGLLQSLDAPHVRLAVPGWRRVEEVVPRLRALPAVHAIDLCRPVDAAAAVEFLGLAVPVGTIDGRPATVDGWLRHLRPTEPGGGPDLTGDARTETETETATGARAGARAGAEHVPTNEEARA